MRRVLILLTALATMLFLLASTVTAKPTGAGPPSEHGDEPIPIPTPAPVFDIDAAPDGSLLVAGAAGLWEIRGGEVSSLTEVPRPLGVPMNGVSAIGRGSSFATSGGLDLAVGAGVWHVSRGQAHLIGDVEAFETANDPDAFEGPMWKEQACEFVEGVFSAGPQSNPYHLTSESGGTALVADAAGNTVLAANKSGAVDWVAVLTPPTDANDDWLVQYEIPGLTCYVQPVPTAVAVGAHGDYYVGELTGLDLDETFTPQGVTGSSRVWRIDAGARNVVCPSAQCEAVLAGLTSVIDVEVGPDGYLYVLEYDRNGWFDATEGNPDGGQLSKCDIVMGSCDVIYGDDEFVLFPGAIAFDNRGTLWILEGNVSGPTVKSIDY